VKSTAVDAPKTDIRNRDDLVHLLVAFYKRLLEDPAISYIFTEVVALDFEHHIPRIADFWESILFQTAGYDGNPMRVHIALHEKTPLTAGLFEIWVDHFCRAADENFEGDMTKLAKERARSIAELMKIKIL
jgi:hemoglobin